MRGLLFMELKFMSSLFSLLLLIYKVEKEKRKSSGVLFLIFP